MDLQKWTEKAGKIADKLCMSADIVYSNTDEGALFARKSAPYVAYFIHGHCFASFKRGSQHGNWMSDNLEKVFFDAVQDIILAETVETGHAVRNGRTVKATRFTCGDRSAVVRDSLLKDFPKNSLYYITERKYILVCIEEGSIIPIGLVMPILSEFIPEEDAV